MAIFHRVYLIPFFSPDMLLESKESKVYDLAQETIVLVLEFNPDQSMLLDWVVDRCFTGDAQVADGCFLALATIFSGNFVYYTNFFKFRGANATVLPLSLFFL